MKRKILLLLILFFIINHNHVYAFADEIMDKQLEKFGISSFIREAEKYNLDFFEGLDLKEMLNSAITGNFDNKTLFNKILNLFFKEVIQGIRTVAIILVIIIIHSILKAISDSLESSNVSQIIYYVQYILIVLVIMSNFSEIIQMVKTTASNLVGFMNLLIPLLVTLIAFTGNIATSSLLEPIILFMVNALGNCLNTVFIPVILIITAITIISKVSDQIQIGKLSKLLNSGIVWFLSISLTIFVTTISLEGNLSSSVDGITAKTAKAVASSAIPVVGGILR